jgi:molecular chaperone GrpE
VNGEELIAEAGIVPETGAASVGRGGMSAEVRQRLMEQFGVCLDRMAAGEPPPPGFPPELLVDSQAGSDGEGGLETDLYTLFSAMTALSGEVRLQGRAFKQLTDALAPLAQLAGRFDQLEAAQIQVAEEVSQCTEAIAATDESELPPAKELLNVLFDLYDRLERGMRTLADSQRKLEQHAAGAGWRQRWFGAGALAENMLATIQATREAHQLIVARLNAAFGQWGIERIGAVGEPFDPALMNVIEVQPDQHSEDGMILDVYRSGYVLHDTLLVTAQVKVCRNTESEELEPSTETRDV